MLIAFIIAWIASIVGMTLAIPQTKFFFDLPGIVTFLGITNIFILIGIPLLSILFLFARLTIGYRPGLKLKTGLWGFWALNVIGFFAMISFAAREFSNQTEITQSFEVPLRDTINLESEKVNVRNENIVFEGLTFGEDQIFCKNIELSIRKSEDDKFSLTQVTSSQGPNAQIAGTLAEEIQYPITIDDDKISFGKEFIIPNGSKFRNQTVELILNVPEGKVVKIGKGLRHYTHNLDLADRHVGPWSNTDKYWNMESNGLACNNCNDNNEVRLLELTDFNKVQVDGRIKVNVEHGETYKVELVHRKKYKDKVDVVTLGDMLTVSTTLKDSRSPIKLNITMPYLESIDTENTDDLRVVGFTQPAMSIINNGRADIKAIVNVDSLTVRQGGRSELKLSGKGTWLSAKVHEHGKLDAERFNVKVADVHAIDFSKADLTVSDTITMRTEAGSEIQFEGDAIVLAEAEVHQEE